MNNPLYKKGDVLSTANNKKIIIIIDYDKDNYKFVTITNDSTASDIFGNPIEISEAGTICLQPYNVVDRFYCLAEIKCR
jgi:hypothetical protein